MEASHLAMLSIGKATEEFVNIFAISALGWMCPQDAYVEQLQQENATRRR